MNKVAVHHNSSYRDSPPSTLPHFRPAVMEQKQFNKQPSRLQMLQADYQERLLREKEQKMIQMYEDQQKKALGRVNQRLGSGNTPNGVSAREFFQQRRTLEQKGYQSPPIQEHYRQMRRGYSSGGYSSASSHASSRYGKNSAGKDRSNLLQPIDKRSPPVPTKPRMARQRPNGVQARNNANNLRSTNGNYDVKQDISRTSSSDSSPPPNLQTLRNFQRKRLGAPPHPRDENEGQQKLTDYQRWQLEQNKAREQRLDNHRRSEGRISQGGQQWGDGESVDADSENMNEELEQKQREIAEEIERQKRELENMKRQKELEEEEERRAAEAERKREVEREKRRRQQAAEERKRRKEEEERERMEEEKQQREERQQREEEKRKQMYEQKKRQQQQRGAPPPKARTPSPVEDDYQPPDSNLDMYIQAAMADDSSGEIIKLAPCKMCGRKFAAERLSKHQAACKTANKKRKVFDPTKMRTEGTEMAQYIGKSKAPKKQPKKKDWRAQHESFIETIRYAKKVSEMEAAGVKAHDLPPPPKSVNPDYVKCPTCNRNFNPTTAERHIPNCRARPRR